VQRAYVMAQGEFIDEAWLPGAGDAAGMSGWGPLSGMQEAAASPAAHAAPAVAHESPPVPEGVPSVTLPIGSSVAEAERVLMLATLRHFNHHKERTAAALGISLKTLYNRLKEYAAEGVAVSDRPPQRGGD
jgi:DNA-binding NtrC family response regulator